MPPPSSTDFLVLGGGIIGVCVARELRRRHPGRSVTLLEKEPAVGLHASGRNSGVLHAGFYYSADSLKARFCRDGNRALREYIQSRGLALNPCGKLVVARTEADLPQLDELLRRGKKNGVELQSVTAKEAQVIEPRVKTFERALWSPGTATADPTQVVASVDGGPEVDFGLVANERGDVNEAHPGYGLFHGFDRVLPAGPGPHQVCAVGVRPDGSRGRATCVDVAG